MVKNLNAMYAVTDLLELIVCVLEIENTSLAIFLI